MSSSTWRRRARSRDNAAFGTSGTPLVLRERGAGFTLLISDFSDSIDRPCPARVLGPVAGRFLLMPKVFQRADQLSNGRPTAVQQGQRSVHSVGSGW